MRIVFRNAKTTPVPTNLNYVSCSSYQCKEFSSIIS